MVHLLGAVLVAVGGALLGFQAAAGLRKRGRAVRQMEEGLALLERELEKAKPKLLCVTPTCHNPTNATMSMDRRLHLATLAHRYGFPVIEWSHCGDLEPEDTDVIPLKAIDTNGFVIYINSFTMSFAQSIPRSPRVLKGHLHMLLTDRA